MSRIISGFGGFKGLLALLVVGLITAVTIIPGIFNITDAQTKTGKGVERRASKTGSHEAGIENYDIRLDKNDSAVALMYSFRNDSSFTAADAADARDGFVRGEERLRMSVETVKVEYSPDLRAPEVITPSVWADNMERLTAPSSAKRSDILRNFVKQNSELFGMPQEQADELIVSADYENPAGNMSFAHLDQQINGIPVFRGEVKAGFTRAGQMIRVINNLAPGLELGSVSKNFGDPAEAVKAASENIRHKAAVGRSTLNEKESTDQRVVFGYGDSATTAEKIYFPVEPGVARAAWRVLIWKPVNAYYVIIDAETNAVLWRKNITEDQTQPATYGVYRNSNAYIDVADSPAPISPGPISPLLGTQGAFISRTDVSLTGKEAPNTFNDLGWITDGGNTTDGNNVQSGLDRELPNADFPANPADIDPNGMATGSPNRIFSYVYNPLNPNTGTGDPPLPAGQSAGTCQTQGTATAPTAYQQGAVTQLFYTTNRYHDKMYELGFTEAARNFQNSNFGRGGSENDRISAQAQDCSDTDNANFSTPGDGTRGQMQMYIFTGPTPDSDGDLDAEIVIHELTHGTSNRLHSNAGGLTTNMSRGMGEGWSDFFAHSMLAESTDPINGIYAAGAYATFVGPGPGPNAYYGVRRFPKAVIAFTGGPNNRPHNPLTFGDLNAGCNLSDGAFAPSFTTTCDQVHAAGEIWSSLLWEVRAKMVTRLGFNPGTTRVLQIVVDGMKLSPGNPTFVQARDSIISAATALSFDGSPEAAADVVDVREGFRLRGMGFAASVTQASQPATITESFDFVNVRHIDPFSVTETAGDGDGFPEPGETVALNIPIINQNLGGAISNVQVNVNGGSNINVGTINDGQTVIAQVSYTIPGGASCGSLHQVTVNVSSPLGAQVPVTREFRLGAPVAGAPVTFTNTNAITIADNVAASPYPSTINVSGLAGNKGIKLKLVGLTHTAPLDLDILLVGPGGQKFMAMSDMGGVGDVSNIDLTLVDSASSELSTSQLVTGEFRPGNTGTASDAMPGPAPPSPYDNPAPAGSATFASSFGENGSAMNGAWSLYVRDDEAVDIGSIAGGWTLSFATNYVCEAASFGSVTGRVVTVGGRGIGGATVSITDGVTTRSVRTSTFGYFSFSNVQFNVQHTITPRAKRYNIPPQQVTPTGNVTGLIFVGTQ